MYSLVPKERHVRKEINSIILKLYRVRIVYCRLCLLGVRFESYDQSHPSNYVTRYTSWEEGQTIPGKGKMPKLDFSEPFEKTEH